MRIKIGGIVTVPSFSAPAPRVRPGVVTAAAYLLYLVAALEVVNAIITFATLGPVTDAIQDAYAGTTLSDSAESIITAVYAGGAVLNLVLGAGFAVLGAFDSRGKNWARIVTWVIGGIGLCCLGAGLGSKSISSSMQTGSDTAGGPTADEVQRRLNDALPSWYTPVSTTTTVLVLLILLVVIILLALPKSNEFFRKQPAADGWDQPGGYPAYPGQATPYPPAAQSYPPPAPPYPGQQQPPAPGQQQPPYPGQQGFPGQQYPGQAPPPSNPWGDQPPNPPTTRF